MKSIFDWFRRYLIVLLTVASAVSAWPLAEIEELDGVDSNSRPALSETGPGLVGIVQCAAQITNKASAQTPSFDTALLPSSCVKIDGTFASRIDSQIAVPSRTAFHLYPNKTGPPSA